MPLIVMTGIPSSGKSKRSYELKEYLESEHNKKVHIVSESEVISSSNTNKNALYLDSIKEKDLRSRIKSLAHQLIGRDGVVILDAANYIKGCRYELYCMSKSSKTTQCTVQCEAPVHAAWNWNTNRPSSIRSGEQQYSQESFDALVMRYEPPNRQNRWDSPLFVIQPNDPLPGQEIFAALFDRKPPPPNQSTQSAPLSATNYLHELDRITQDITTAILSFQNSNLEGDVKISGHQNLTIHLGGRRLTAAQLGRFRRQFLTYSRMHPSSDTSCIGQLFIHFLNTSMAT